MEAKCDLRWSIVDARAKVMEKGLQTQWECRESKLENRAGDQRTSPEKQKIDSSRSYFLLI